MRSRANCFHAIEGSQTVPQLFFWLDAIVPGKSRLEKRALSGEPPILFSLTRKLSTALHNEHT